MTISTESFAVTEFEEVFGMPKMRCSILESL